MNGTMPPMNNNGSNPPALQNDSRGPQDQSQVNKDEIANKLERFAKHVNQELADSQTLEREIISMTAKLLEAQGLESTLSEEAQAVLDKPISVSED